MPKDRSVIIRLARGTQRRLSSLIVGCTPIECSVYGGSILNSTRPAIGSQCSSLNSGVAWQNFVAQLNHEAGRPILHSLESLDLFEWESVQQRIANVEFVCHICVHNLLCCTRG